MAKNTICVWYDKDAEAATRFYAETFPDSAVGTIWRAPGDYPSGKKGDVLVVEFKVAGVSCIGLNGGPQFKFNESISFVIECEDQKEIDYYWENLSFVPESEQCGWLKDKFGVSWQVVPKNIDGLIQTPAAMQAMLKMKKIVIDELKNAK